MPRKTKESDNKKLTLKDYLLPKSKKSVDIEKKSNTTTKKSKTLKEKDSAKLKKDTSKKVAPKTKVAEKQEILKSSNKKTDTSTKKLATSKSTKTKTKSSNSVSSKSKTTTKKQIHSFSPEYYDLPYKYNKTIVKILAQTPNNLYIYWEISDEDRENLKKQYGEYFFEITKPVLIIHNETLNYYFEIDINDFANSWYLHVDDSDCEYKIELGRRPIPVNYNYIPQYDLEKNGPIEEIKTSYIYISSSNDLKTPNDHILFNKQNKIYFRNIKTNEIIEKDIKNFPFIAKDNKFISIYQLYEDLYKEEILNNSFDLNNPSSGNPSSGSLSSKFL